MAKSAEFEFPKECSGCKKKLNGDDYSEYYSVFQCRKDHWIVCCKVDCQRLLDKRCSKVSEQLRKMQHKLNNDGHTSALRRLPPAEREKLKQYAEAENNNLLICPLEMKAVDRSVPYCGYIMDWKGGYGKQTRDKDDDEAADIFPGPPPLGGATSSRSEVGDGLVDDDDLVELKRDDDQDLDETPSSKQKKGTKNKSQKKSKNVIQLDFRTPGLGGDEVYPEASAPSPVQKPAAWFQNPALRNINGTAVSQAWNAKAGTPTEAGSMQRPPNFATLLRELVGLVGCSESKATELLEQNQYRLESAADAYFCQESGVTEAVDNKPRWGPRLGASARSAQQPSQVSQSLDEGMRETGQEEEDESSGLQPPAPTQPPPPRLPPEWQALWNEQQNAYYYWHMPTNHTTWDAPTLDDESAEDLEASAVAAAKLAEEARQKAEEDGRNVMVKKVSDITRLSSSQSRSLLESHGWGLEQALKSHTKEVEQRKRELEEQRRAEEEKRAAEQLRKRIEEEARERQARERERHKKSQQGDSQPERLPAEFLINQNWRPQDDGCLRLFKGGRVMVKWMDDSLHGWVYGHCVDDEAKLGYFPREVLQKVKRRSRQRDIGELCGIQEFFQAPEEVRGYLNVAPGDLIKVLHPMDEPFVWAYAEVVKSETAAAEERGWLPESALCDPSEAAIERCPHPAG